MQLFIALYSQLTAGFSFHNSKYDYSFSTELQIQQRQHRFSSRGESLKPFDFMNNPLPTLNGIQLYICWLSTMLACSGTSWQKICICLCTINKLYLTDFLLF